MQQASVKGCRCWKTGFSAGLKLPYVGYDDHWLSDPMCNRKPPSAEISKRSGIAGKTHSVNPLNLMFIRLGFQVSGVLGFWALRADPMLSCRTASASPIKVVMSSHPPLGITMTVILKFWLADQGSTFREVRAPNMPTLKPLSPCNPTPQTLPLL